MKKGPLAGLRILDLSRLLPGPYATLVLADLGADVVKIEDPAGGDYLRWIPPLQDGTSALFLALNRGKRSVALNLKDTADRDRFLTLAASADVVLESFRPGVMARLGLGWEALHAHNPRLILCSISGYGQTGAHAARAGHDIDFLALSGLLGLMGPANAAPALPNAQLADVAGGSWVAVSGILAALLERTRTGTGRWVDVSMTEGIMSTLAMSLAPRLAGVGPAPQRGRGPLSGEAPCYGIYETADGGHLAVGAMEPKFWEGFCHALGLPELVPHGLDEGDAAVRTKEMIARVLARRPLSEWVTVFASLDVCVEPVLSAENLPSHPVHEARGTFFKGPHGWMHRTPIRFADGQEPQPPATAAPTLGGDDPDVFREWLERR